MKYETYNNKEDLEFGLFKEINFDFEADTKKDERENLKDLLKLQRNNFFCGKIVKIMDNQVLTIVNYYSGNTIYKFENEDNFKGGETIIFRENKDEIKNIKIVEEEVLNEKYLEEQEKIKEDNNIYLTEEDLEKIDVFSKEKISKVFEDEIKEQKRIEEEEEKKEAEEKVEKKITEEQDKKKYEEQSIYENNYIKIKENKIERIGENIYILKEDVNKVFDWETINKINTSAVYSWINGGYKLIEEKLFYMEINFEIQVKDDNGNYIKKYDIVFEKDKKKELIASLENKELKSTIKINGVKIRKAKQQFILYRIEPETTKEEIELWNKLTGMKIEALNLKQITLNNKKSLNLDINIDIIDNNNFTINFMTTKKKVDWDYLKKMFFYGGGSRSINSWWRNENILTLVKDLGIKKQDFFDYLKKASIMKELEKNN